jgi:hypothetical protein
LLYRAGIVLLHTPCVAAIAAAARPAVATAVQGIAVATTHTVAQGEGQEALLEERPPLRWVVGQPLQHTEQQAKVRVRLNL